jgi:ABC-type branched-subunit amino acid transport system substrate-binding protein
MAISESGLKDALLMQVDLQNQRGGLLGRPLQVVSQDPASNWSMYGEKARQLIERENVAAIFGCWTSASRKEVKSVVEELGALLFYPVQYEGREQSPNIIYLGAAPSQQAAWNYFMSIDSPGNRQFISGLRSVIGDSSAVVNDPIEAQAIVFRLWVKAVQWAGTTDPEVVRKTVIGMEVTNLSGGSATLLPNHHLSKPVYIGEIRPDGQYNVMWHSAANVDGNPWFDPTSSDKAQ